MGVVTAAHTESSIAARYEALIQISNSIRARNDPQALFDILVRQLNNVTPFDAIALFDASANNVHWHLCADRLNAENFEAHAAEELPRLVYRTQEPIILETLTGDAQFAQLRDAGIESLCAFPLTTAHRRLGSLLFTSTRPAAYSPDDIRFCSLAAEQIALAAADVLDAAHFRASLKAQGRLELLLDLTNRAVSNLNLRDVLRQISAQVRQVMDCHGVGIVLPNRADGKLRLYAVDYGEHRCVFEEGFELPADSPAVRAFETGEVVNVYGEEIDHASAIEAGIQSMANLPMRAGEGIVGVLGLGTKTERAFPPDDLPFLQQVANQVAIAIENARAYGEVSDQKQKLTLEKLYLEDEIRSELRFEEIVGKSEAIRRVLEEVQIVAATDSTVLIYGETGTGKELIARAVHNLSARRAGSFVKLNCAAIPTGLLESEMFGHEKGAFTGAIAQRVGRFELANRGTMFLDEIGEIPLDLQPKLLRVLQEREFERLGSARTLRTDARLIAATNRDLDSLVKEQKFRSDLYYRLNVFPVRVPALRERADDIPLLVRYFVQQFTRKQGKTIEAIPAETMSALVRYPWPGNIRELQNVIERAVILSTGPVLEVRTEDLRVPGEAPGSSAAEISNSLPETPARNMQQRLKEAERQEILAALEQSNWIVSGPEGAAARLGVKRSTLQSRMRKFGIQISRSGA